MQYSAMAQGADQGYKGTRAFSSIINACISVCCKPVLLLRRPLKRRKVEHTNDIGDDSAAADASGAAPAADPPLAAGAGGDVDGMAEDIEDVAALPPQAPALHDC